MQIFINTISGKIISLEVESNNLIKDLKTQIQVKEGISTENQILFFSGQNLEDNKSLDDYSITDKATINLRARNSNENITINVKTIDNTTISISISPRAQIMDIKSLIETKTNIPADRQKLFYNDQELVEFYQIKEYSITDNSQINLSILPSENIQIFINTLSDKLIPLDVKPTDLIRSIKEQIQKKKQIQSNQQRLFFNQKELEDLKTIRDYMIQKNSILTMILISKSDMKIVIKSPAKLFTLDVDRNEKIEYVKEKIQFFSGFFLYQQRLTYAGILLEDCYTLEDYLIPNNGILEMALFLQDGILIFIKIGRGKYIPFEVQPTDSILSFKSVVQKKFDISIDQIDLFFKEQKLEDEKTIQDYSIHNQSVLNISIKPPENMFICIKALKGEKIIIDVKPTDQIESIREKIEQILKIPQNQQKLIFAGEQLENGYTLQDYSIFNESQILLIPISKKYFQIFVKAPNGRKITVDVESTDKIKDVKKKIQEKEDKFQVEKQELFLNDRKLEDDNSLDFYSIRKDTSLGFLLLSKSGITVFVKTNKFNLMPIEVEPSDSIEKIKAKVNENEGFLLDDFKLFVNERQLENGKKVEDYKFHEGQIIHLSINLKGNMKIFIKFNEERIPIEVESSFSIEDVKKQILYQRGIPVEMQNLFFDGTNLENSKKLEDYSVTNCSLLVLNRLNK